MALLPIVSILTAHSFPFKGIISRNPSLRASTIHYAVPVKLHTLDYDAFCLSGIGLSRELFNKAVKGYEHLLKKGMIANDAVLTIIDYSRPSVFKRLFILDMQKGTVLFNSLVAHGRNSGGVYASDFSNVPESGKSSLGFYITLNTYIGANGYSLKLKGCEKGINDNALGRAIVLHGADYVSEAFIRNCGYLGRSLGCPAVPQSIHKKIIDTIKNGSCVFIYHSAKKYSKG